MATFNVKADASKALKAIETYGDRAVGAVYAGVLATGYQALDVARTEAPKDTTTLARSITLEEDRDALAVDIFTNLEYAAINEFGFDGVQDVRQHERTISQAFGRRIPPVTVTVTAHERRVVRKARPFMGPAADLAQERIGPNIDRELEALRL